MSNTKPTPEELNQHGLKTFKGIEVGLGAVDISRWLDPTGVHCMDVCPDTRYVNDDEVETYKSGGDVIPRCPRCGESASWTGYDERIDWVVVGGESGSNACPMHPDWARSLRDKCAEAGVPFLFKQWGEWLPDNQNPSIAHPHDESGAIRVGKKSAGRLLDGVLHDGHPAARHV